MISVFFYEIDHDIVSIYFVYNITPKFPFMNRYIFSYKICLFEIQFICLADKNKSNLNLVFTLQVVIYKFYCVVFNLIKLYPK
jgi:hypothetical protein